MILFHKQNLGKDKFGMLRTGFCYLREECDYCYERESLWRLNRGPPDFAADTDSLVHEVAELRATLQKKMLVGHNICPTCSACEPAPYKSYHQSRWEKTDKKPICWLHRRLGSRETLRAAMHLFSTSSFADSTGVCERLFEKLLIHPSTYTGREPRSITN